MFNFRITMRALKTAELSKVKAKAMEYQVVAIDEGQFFHDIV
jgi:thymidine kinase